MSDNRNILITYLKTIKKIRSLLFGKISRDFLIFLFFVFISFCFWMLQTMNNVYETEVKIPLIFKNLPKKIVITSDIPSLLKITVKDKGTVLANYSVGKHFKPVVIDFLDIKDRGDNASILPSEFIDKISSQLNQSTKILSISPDTIDFIYTYAKAKKIPIKLRGSVKSAKGYYISGIKFLPDSLLVYAPLNILDTLNAIYTSSVNILDLDVTKSYNVSLLPIKGVKSNVKKVKMTLFIDVFANKSLEVPIVGIDFPENKKLRTFPSKVTVSFQVGSRHYNSVVADNFMLVVPYESLKDSKEDKCKVFLRSYPDYVNHVNISPSEVDYLIEEK